MERRERLLRGRVMKDSGEILGRDKPGGGGGRNREPHRERKIEENLRRSERSQWNL